MVDDGQVETVAGEVAYQWSPWRYAVTRFVIGALGAGLGILLLYVLFSVAAGGSVVPDLIGIMAFVVIYVPGFAGFSVHGEPHHESRSRHSAGNNASHRKNSTANGAYST